MRTIFANLSKGNMIKIGLFLVLLIGVIVGVILVQRQQILKSKATNHLINAFEFKDANGNPITCDTSVDPPVCTTSTLDVQVRVKDPSLLQ